MNEKGLSCHVAKIKTRYKDRVYTSVLLRRTYREGGKVKHQTLGNLTGLSESVIDAIGRAVKGEALVSAGEAFEITRTLPHGHTAAVLGTLRKLGLDRMISAKPCRERDLVSAMIAARVLDPQSKLATARGWGEETCAHSLGETLGIGEADEQDLYAAMDWLAERKNRVESALAERRLGEDTLVLYDVTSSYFEGRSCPLARFGHNRDGKRGKLQIVYGLLCNADGCPVAVEVFEGNTADPKTLAAQIEKVKDRFGLARVVFVGDRGMITEPRIRDELKPVAGLDWITALGAKKVQKLAQNGSLQMSLFDETNLAEITDPDYPGERLVVCRNPVLAAERAHKRDELLQATERELDKIVAATQRPKRRLTGKAKIGIRVGKVINRFKMAKHFRVQITDDSFTFERRAERIAHEALLDGIYVIRTSVPQEKMSKEQAVGSYKSLSRVERAFRTLKGVDLKVRPIHHRLAERVKTHVFLCMLAYYVEWHMRQALAPLLFQDDDPAGAEAARESIVAPAKRSASARRKASSKRNGEGGPAHSFKTLLQDLATVAKNRACIPGREDSAFTLTTIPTPLQQRAIDLLGVNLNL